jgi:tetratricopeptide (TPR) repeat protein
MNVDLEIPAVELANVLASQGRTAEAIVAYQAAVAARPAEISWHCNLAALLSESGRHEEAIRETDAALALDPDCGAALYNQATSLLALGRAPAARERLERCARLTPEDARVHNNLGLALAAEGQYQSQPLMRACSKLPRTCLKSGAMAARSANAALASANR